MATSDGFVLNFTADGRTAVKKDRLEYDTNRDLGKIESMVLYLLKFIKIFQEKQKNRLRENIITEKVKDEFVVTMDNYFTLPKILRKL